ncbi:uncharacterized protein LOC127082436 [Lathyrus oleraceus]|uniref:uncharacterized protein LOC127082436 n=1 Tax=Pisum sativum TaxID=3888 RepID=UPI0021D0A96B|nr:uncharacterized protein LOC127082436 [Pisum sativum]
MVRRRGADGRIPVRTLDRGASSSAAAAEPTGYPGGPYDTSLLVKYEHHVARHIWFGEERGPKKELKVAGHGLKLNSRVPLALPPQMESWVSRSGLASLQRTSLNKIDTNLVSAFVERWHLETSSFHMPFGEMSITLDDVACLLHLPIRGIFWSPQDVTEELTADNRLENNLSYKVDLSLSINSNPNSLRTIDQPSSPYPCNDAMTLNPQLPSDSTLTTSSMYDLI